MCVCVCVCVCGGWMFVSFTFVFCGMWYVDCAVLCTVYVKCLGIVSDGAVWRTGTGAGKGRCTHHSIRTGRLGPPL